MELRVRPARFERDRVAPASGVIDRVSVPCSVAWKSTSNASDWPAAGESSSACTAAATVLPETLAQRAGDPGHAQRRHPDQSAYVAQVDAESGPTDRANRRRIFTARDRHAERSRARGSQVRTPALRASRACAAAIAGDLARRASAGRRSAARPDLLDTALHTSFVGTQCDDAIRVRDEQHRSGQRLRARRAAATSSTAWAR